MSHQKADKGEVQKSCSNYIEYLNIYRLGLCALMVHSYCRQNQTGNHTRPPEACSLQIIETIQGRTRAAAAAGDHHTTRCG